MKSLKKYSLLSIFSTKNTHHSSPFYIKNQRSCNSVPTGDHLSNSHFDLLRGMVCVCMLMPTFFSSYPILRVARTLDFEQLTHEIHLHARRNYDHKYLHNTPGAHIALIILNQRIISRLTSSRMRLILWHKLQIILHCLHRIREIIHVQVHLFDLFRELLPIVVLHHCDVEIDEFRCESWELIVDAHRVVATSWLCVSVVGICLPLVRMDELTRRMTHGKPSHTISTTNHLKIVKKVKCEKFIFFCSIKFPSDCKWM